MIHRMKSKTPAALSPCPKFLRVAFRKMSVFAAGMLFALLQRFLELLLGAPVFSAGALFPCSKFLGGLLLGIPVFSAGVLFARSKAF